MTSVKVSALDPEKIAHWFFRLNGCFTFDNFLVHHPQRGITGTDIDVLAVRFPYRRELDYLPTPTLKPMRDHELFEVGDCLIDIFLVEVKRGQMRINPTWRSREDGNLERLLTAIGPFRNDLVEKAAESLYSEYRYVDSMYRVRIVAVGKEATDDIKNAVTTLDWQQMLAFIYERLNEYRYQKSQHIQWDHTGKQLFRLMQSSSRNDGKQSFVDAVIASWQQSSA